MSSGRYLEGEILVFTGGVSRFEGEISHSSKFKKGHHYTIESTSTIDYDLNDISHDYGKEVIYFKDYTYGCFFDFADKFFMKLEDYRTHKIDNLLDE